MKLLIYLKSETREVLFLPAVLIFVPHFFIASLAAKWHQLEKTGEVSCVCYILLNFSRMETNFKKARRRKF